MITNELVLATITQDNIGLLTLNRPEKHNAFNHDIITDIIQKLLYFQNTNIKFLIIHANGKHFSAGADLNWMADMATKNIDDNIKDAMALAEMLYLIHHFEKPTIAIVQGSAFGGGAGIVAACDMAVASEQAQFGFTETKIGLIPATISPYVIYSIGAKLANYYFLTAKIFTAQTALNIGLCHEIVPAEKIINIDFLSSQLPIVQALHQNSPQALIKTKKLVKELSQYSLDNPDILYITANKIAACRASIEAQEGMAAFLEKRQPNWINPH